MDKNNKCRLEGNMPSTSSQKKPIEVHNIVPVMIGQILRSSSNFQLWGIPVCSVLVIVGILRSINESTTKITYEVEDETGTITAIRWLKAKRTTEESLLKINNYVRIVGRLHIEKGVKQIVIMRIQHLNDLNELTNHLLEVTYITLKGEKQYDGEVPGGYFSVNMNDSSKPA